MSIAILNESGFASWAELFRQYNEFHHKIVPTSQYQKTFARILSNDDDLHASIIRDDQDNEKIVGLSHYITYSSTSHEKKCCPMMGMLSLNRRTTGVEIKRLSRR